MNDVKSLLAANAAYYRAFQARDFKEMERVWADEDVSCIHPGWSLLAGRGQVLESYRRILANPGQASVSCSDETVMVSGEIARVFCTENVGGGTLAATNLFALTSHGWRLIHHHASPIAVAVPQQRRVLN
jgi:ketosteroid isomerase-like protein